MLRTFWLGALLLMLVGSRPGAITVGLRTTAGDERADRSTGAPPSADPPSSAQPHPAWPERMRRVAGRVYSSGEPGGPSSTFALLRSRGVTTIVSVDGLRPPVDEAREAGIRYVHIPIGYDGIDTDARRFLAAVARQSRGKILVHCHHGRHRGPAAAAMVAMADGTMDAAEAHRFLVEAGTSPRYEGLWRDVEAFVVPADLGPLELPEAAEADSAAAAMARLDRSFRQLQRCREAGWATPADHPDVTPSHAAVLTVESLREARRHLDGGLADLGSGLHDAEMTATKLLESIESGAAEEATRHLARLQQQCAQCHQRHRDH